MHAKRFALGSILIGGLLASCTTADRGGLGGGGGGQIDLSYQNPQEFTDMRRTFSAGRGADEGYLSELRNYIERIGPSRVPAGYTLSITISDVDMAGDFEPERGPDLTDVRVVRSVYPPRINLNYRLVDASGTVVSQGERQLRNNAFDWRLDPINREDPLRHEKALLEDFLNDVAKEA